MSTPQPRRVYLASSWRNLYRPEVLAYLRGDGHQVYDFKNPSPGKNGFRWLEIDPEWENWSSETYRKALEHPVAWEGFLRDWEAMEWADTGVLLLPCGRSAHLEAGYFCGAKKDLFVLLLDKQEPELMYKMANKVCLSIEGLLRALRGES